MKFQIGSNILADVEIPLLWGDRAVLQDREGRLSVIDLGGRESRLEILGDEPAPEVEFLPTSFGFEIHSGGVPLYSYGPKDKLLTAISLRLPQCSITPDGTRVGTNYFAQNLIIGAAVAIAVTEDSTAIGAPMPEGLSKLSMPKELTTGTSVRLADFGSIITDQTFEDCEILGPAILAPRGSGGFYNCGWEGDADSLFWELPTGERIVGATVAENCVFTRCRFVNVGIAGTKDDIDRMRAGFSTETENSQR